MSQKLDRNEPVEAPLEAPLRVVMSIPAPEDKKGYPTIVTVYRAPCDTPTPDFLARAENAALDFSMDDPGSLALTIAFERDQAEESFSLIRHIDLDGPADQITEFKKSVLAIGRFVWVVSAEDFQFRCLVNFETTEVMQYACDSRYLN